MLVDVWMTAYSPNEKISFNTTAAKDMGAELAPNDPGFRNVVVLQVADPPFALRMQNNTKQIQEWANCMDYIYRLELINVTKRKGPECVYSQKAYRIHQALDEMTDDSWLVFLDADVQYRADFCDDLERWLPQQSRFEPRPCEIIALHTGLSINSGVLVLKATSSVKRLVQRWYEYQRKHPFCHGPGDQIALQEIILQEYQPNYTGACGQVDKHQNRCFWKHLDHTSIRNLCLTKCHDPQPLQCRGCQSGCRRNPIFHHHKHERIQRTRPLIIRNRTDW